ncbi:altered inheritance of mitochondria protein 41 [Trichophyton mentagrophytes]|nr:altered inheritance of mitochondria protein 41 [Trichophyton mentagrophytes]
MIRSFRFQSPLLRHSLRYSTSSTPGVAPLFAKIKTDLKAAMRAKDKVRLDVLRGIISEVNNAAKTPKPIETDLSLLDLLRKRAANLEASGKEYAAADRQDLLAKAEEERKVVEEYAAQVETVSEDAIRAAVESAIAELKAASEKLAIGSVMKKVLAAGGALDGKPASKTAVAKIAGEMVKALEQK